jgi:hypothetical protein
MLVRPEKKVSLDIEVPEHLAEQTMGIASKAKSLGYCYDVEGFVTKALMKQNRKMSAALDSLESARSSAEEQDHSNAESEAEGDEAPGD